MGHQPKMIILRLSHQAAHPPLRRKRVAHSDTTSSAAGAMRTTSKATLPPRMTSWWNFWRRSWRESVGFWRKKGQKWCEILPKKCLCIFPSISIYIYISSYPFVFFLSLSFFLSFVYIYTCTYIIIYLYRLDHMHPAFWWFQWISMAMAPGIPGIPRDFPYVWCFDHGRYPAW